MCGSGYVTYPKLLPPTLNFFLQILNLEENSRTKLFCSAILFQLQNLEKKICIKMTIKFLCIQWKDFIKNRPFHICLVLFNTFPSRSVNSKKKKLKKKKKDPTYLPYFSQGVIWTTQCFLFGLISQDTQHFLRKIVIFSLPININMCFGCSKEPSHWDGSFEYPQHMVWLRNKKNITIIFMVLYR